LKKYSLLEVFLLIAPPVLIIMSLLFGFTSFFGDQKVFLSLFLATWMVLWWIFELVPLGVTALLPLFFLPVTGVLPIKDVSPAYANPVIFLFLGGFIIARALEKTKLDERIALNILRVTGHSDFGVVLGFTISTAFLSMWISNTATTVMMVPIALSVMHFLEKNLSDSSNSVSIASMNTVLFLSIAYSANIGGIMTPVGTPPNVVLLGYLQDLYGKEIHFSSWVFATAPLAILLLAVMLFILKSFYPFHLKIPKNFRVFLENQIQELGRINRKQMVTIGIFISTASLWIFKGLIHQIAGFSFLNDTSIAIFGGVLAFSIPTDLKSKKPVLEKKDISTLPWDIVLLFGGGMALAGALKEVGLIQMSTDYFASLEFSNTYMIIFTIAALSLFLTEIMSNVALCVVALPMIMKLGETQGLAPSLIAIPAALCASFAFSMPISTPPNAIVFGTNRITVKQMLKAGVVLNLIAIALTMTVGYHLISFFDL
jgi:sodium-dependent dicarboxylate transporter 2/3/5